MWFALQMLHLAGQQTWLEVLVFVDSVNTRLQSRGTVVSAVFGVLQRQCASSELLKSPPRFLGVSYE